MSDTPEEKVLRDLSWANGWKKTPEIVVQCLEKQKNGQHPPGTYKEFAGPYRCTHIVVCEACGYRYMVDSGD